MSDTPKTDAFLNAENCSRDNPVAFDWLVGFARQLERELIAAEKRQHQSDLNYDALERVNGKLTAAHRIVDIALECFGERGVRPYAIEQLERAVISWKLNQAVSQPKEAQDD